MEQGRIGADSGFSATAEATAATWRGPDGGPELSEPPAPERNALDFEPVDLRTRDDGWTRQKQRDFIEALADCGIVREAAARVGMTAQTAYRLRRRAGAAAFDRAWRAALRLGAENLRSIAYERAVTGTVKTYYYRGVKVGEDRVYDNRLLMFLIGKAEETAGKDDTQEVIDNWDGWKDAIEDGVDAPPTKPDEAGKPRVWSDSKGRWWTNFPPPPDFEGEQVGEHGRAGFRRLCSGDERKIIGAIRTRAAIEDMRQRDLYFARLKGVPTGT